MEQNGATIKDTTPGKSVAWIDYMTNFNRTFGNFAAGESEDFMVLNRNYEKELITESRTAQRTSILKNILTSLQTQQ